MSSKELFAELYADPEFLAELARVDVSADLCVLLARAGVSRSELAERLGWTRARVTQVLSGRGNLTIDTVHAVTRALGYAFDLVFRLPTDPRTLQPWERQTPPGKTKAKARAVRPAPEAAKDQAAPARRRAVSKSG